MVGCRLAPHLDEQCFAAAVVLAFQLGLLRLGPDDVVAAACRVEVRTDGKTVSAMFDVQQNPVDRVVEGEEGVERWAVGQDEVLDPFGHRGWRG